MPRDGEIVNEELAVLARQTQPRYVHYADYKPKEDFTTWLSGYITRIKTTLGFKNNEMNKVKEEVVRSISGKLTPGPALNAYNRLSDADQNNYERLVERLTHEFTDPRVRQKFNDNKKFNKRKKGQSLKDFAEDIKRDIERYSDKPATLMTVNGIVPNPARVKDGIKRFVKGMRNEEGKKDHGFRDNLDYHLLDEGEMTWDEAIAMATKWERVYNKKSDSSGSSSSSSSSSSDDDDDDDAVKAVETKEKKKKKKKKKKEKRAVAAIADQVHENQMRITKLETSQERMAAAQEGTNTSLQEISAKLDLGLAQGGLQNQQRYQQSYQLSYQQPRFQQGFQQPRFQQNYQQPRSQLQQFQLQQQQQRQFQQQPRQPQTNYVYRPQSNGAFKANPAQNTWGAKNNQPRQGNFGFNRRTPASFPANQAQTQNATKTAVAAADETEIAAAEWDNGEAADEETVSVPMSQFLSMATQAGVELSDENMIAAMGEMDFC